MPIQTLNPATGELLRTFSPLSAESLETRLALAAQAASTYPQETLWQRAFWMKRLALLLDSDAEDLAALITAEMGKTLAEARAEVAKCALACRYYAENADGMLSPETVETDHTESYIRWEPMGVILAVMPWNFPLWQVFRFLAPALMAGNVGLLKHAANVPQCALAVEALVRRAGFPRGVFQTLLLEVRDVEVVLADARVAAVTVTGGEAAGRAVAAQAGWLLKKAVLELGGSDPFIVMPSANLAAAMPAAVKARCINNGQSCIAAKRFLVHEAVYEEFERGFVAGMKALRIGDPADPATEIGPLATESIRQGVSAQVRSALDGGGQVLTGGGPIDRPGFFFEPTVIAGLPLDAEVGQEEIFGPVALLYKVSSLEDAVRLGNATPFGLAASCWTTNAEERRAFTEQLQCGAVFFNAAVASDPRLPFGGVKRSGFGRELGVAGMREFLNAKTVVVDGPARASEAAPQRLAVVTDREPLGEPLREHSHQLATPQVVHPVAGEAARDSQRKDQAMHMAGEPLAPVTTPEGADVDSEAARPFTMRTLPLRELREAPPKEMFTSLRLGRRRA